MAVENRKTLYYLFFVLNTRWGCSLEDLKILLDQINWYEPSRAPSMGTIPLKKSLGGENPAWGGEFSSPLNAGGPEFKIPS